MFGSRFKKKSKTTQEKETPSDFTNAPGKSPLEETASKNFTSILKERGAPPSKEEQIPVEEPLTFRQKLKLFMAAHWRGVLLFIVPLILTPMLLLYQGQDTHYHFSFVLQTSPYQVLIATSERRTGKKLTEKWPWCAFTILIMAVFWVSECIPLTITGFIPLLLFPFGGVMSTDSVSESYINNSVMMFIGSLMLSYSMEQSGLHRRLALFAIRSVGYSHVKLLLAVCSITWFISMWISNTATTSMMIPIVVSILSVFEKEGIIQLNNKDSNGNLVATDIAACYFCAISYTATIGGASTIIGTPTNLVFKSTFVSTYPKAPELLSFPEFAKFAVPHMAILETLCYLNLAIIFLGFLRPGSEAAWAAQINDDAKTAAKHTIETESKKLGKIKCWEWMITIMFGLTVVAFFSRSPQLFTGWGDIIADYFQRPSNFVKDSALIMIVCFLMLFLPSTTKFFVNFRAKYLEDLPKGTIPSVINWRRMNIDMPYSFMFLIGGGAVLSRGVLSSGLAAKLGDSLVILATLPNPVMILLIIAVIMFVTNFGSNIAVVNVFGPIILTLAEKVKANPFWYILTVGIAASSCFMIPVGTPGNLLVKNRVNVSTKKMMKMGLGPTIITLIWTWISISYYAPIIWDGIKTFPAWASKNILGCKSHTERKAIDEVTFHSVEEAPLTFGEKCKLFMAAHWRGVVIIMVPLMFMPMLLPLPGEKWAWCAFTLLVMAIFWVSECIPLAVTGFMPIMIFPLSGVGSTDSVTSRFTNDSVMMFLGSLFLAYSVEQSGLHKRLAYFSIRTIGYSHLKLLLAMCNVTCFVSLWITNTAATSMMIPIVFAILRVFESEKILTIIENNVASDIASCYFCAITFSATVGGVGTLVGTATNLVFKSLFTTAYPEAPELLSFPTYSAFAMPHIIVLEMLTYTYLAVVYFGMLRPNSKTAKSANITEAAKKAAQETIEVQSKNLGNISYWEWMVILLFGGAILSFFCRSPQIFKGWGDIIETYFNVTPRFIKDSALAMFVTFLMFLLPSSLQICKNFTAKTVDELPKTTVPGVLSWTSLNADMPYSFMFLLGGGVALSNAASTSGLNTKLGNILASLMVLHNYVIIFLIILVTVFVTNFASNVAVCNVVGPIAMTLAQKVKVNPLWYIITTGITASYCFMLPVGTPGNLVVKIAGNVPTTKMMKAGFGPTVACIFWTWFCICFYAPIIWSTLDTFPAWAEKK